MSRGPRHLVLRRTSIGIVIHSRLKAIEGGLERARELAEADQSEEAFRLVETAELNIKHLAHQVKVYNENTMPR